jgi:adenine-specific DNA-methyltransferase
LVFFAGSGTTGHAVYNANVADAGNRRFILVQLPEKLDAAATGVSTIADITRERLRRSGKVLKEANPLFAGDLGFRAFRLAPSNIAAWSPKPADLKASLFAHAQHIVEGRTASDILHELLLKLGLDLCVPMQIRTIAGKQTHCIAGGVLFACLDPQIDASDVEPLATGLIAWHQELAPAGDTTCVFRDSAFAGDVAKTNMAAILEQNGIANVRSL